MSFTIDTHKECTLIKPEFGLPFPAEARWGWGARFILTPSSAKPLDFVANRQTTVWTEQPTPEQKQEFIRWVNGSTAFLGRAFTDPEIWTTTDNDEHTALRAINRALRNQRGAEEYIGLQADHSTGRVHLRASTYQSGGYAYVCCWQEQPNDDHTDLWGNWYHATRGGGGGTWMLFSY